MATEINKYGTPQTLRDPIPQQLANQSAMYVQGAQAAASMRNPTPQGDPMRSAMGRVTTDVMAPQAAPPTFRADTAPRLFNPTTGRPSAGAAAANAQTERIKAMAQPGAAGTTAANAALQLPVPASMPPAGVMRRDLFAPGASPTGPVVPTRPMGSTGDARRLAGDYDRTPVAPINPATGMTTQGDANVAALGLMRNNLNANPSLRENLTNAQVGGFNPGGRITVTRQPNGTMSLSDGGRGAVTGAVSYVDGRGEALAGGGLRGKGFGNFNVVAGGQPVVMGPNGSFVATPSGPASLTASRPGADPSQPGVDANGAGTLTSGTKVVGRDEYGNFLTPAAAEARALRQSGGMGNFNPNLTAEQNIQYNREVENAQRINAAGAIQSAMSRNGGGLRGGAVGGGDAAGSTGVSRLRDFAGRGDVSLGALRALASSEGEARGQNITMRSQDVTMRGQDLDFGAKTRGQDLDYDLGLRRDNTALYAADSGVRSKQMELQANQRLRDAVGDIYKRNTGENGEVNQIGVQQDLMRMGLTDQAKAVTESVKGVQEITSKQDDLGKGGFERVLRNAPVSSYKNEKGETVYDKDGTANRVRTILQNRPELSNLSDTELRKIMPDLLAEQGVLEAVNRATQEQGGLGWRGDILPSANASQNQFQQRVPSSFLRNMDMSGEGFFNWIGAEGGDVTLRSGDTWESTYNLGKLNDYERAYLQRRIKEAKEGK